MLYGEKAFLLAIFMVVTAGLLVGISAFLFANYLLKHKGKTS